MRPVSKGLFFQGSSAEPSRAPRRLRVLIVDDERDTVQTLSAILRDDGHDTKGVYSGKDVLAAIEQFDPDVALIDLSMPGLTGWDVAREVREKWPTRPVLIAISGLYTQGADRILTQMTGFNYYFS